MPACSDDSASNSIEETGNVTCRSWGLGHHPSERTSGRTSSRTRSRLQRGRQPADMCAPRQLVARKCRNRVGFSRMRASCMTVQFQQRSIRGLMLTPRTRSMFARENSCCARGRRMCSPRAMAVSDGDGKMPRLRNCLARETNADAHATALRSPIRRLLQKVKTQR